MASVPKAGIGGISARDLSGRTSGRKFHASRNKRRKDSVGGEERARRVDVT